MLMTIDKKAFGKRIKRLREDKQMTQLQLAEATGVPLGTLRNYEQGASMPKAPTIATIARVLGVTVESLFVETESQE